MGLPTVEIGARFGRLVVVREAGRKRKERAWLCVCDCGMEARVQSYSLKTGVTKSCGCLHRERLISLSTTHGCTNEPAFSVWRGMVRRCADPSFKQFKDYGGRGITVCERWLDVRNFIADMGARPLNSQIDRIDNDGNYEPGNCRWATRREQMLNRRVVVRLGIDDKPIAMTAIAHWLAIPYATLYSKLNGATR